MQHSILPFLVSSTTLLFHLEFHGFRSNRGGVCIRLKTGAQHQYPDVPKRHGEPEFHTDRDAQGYRRWRTTFLITSCQANLQSRQS